MGRIAYFDCFSGISGDMVLGALADLGLDLDVLEEALSSLDLEEFRIESKEVTSYSLRATKVNIIAKPAAVVRTFANIRKIIEDSDLPENIKERSLEVFTTLARAESTIHRKPIDQVHFHEVGAVDSIVDIVGTVLGIDYLSIREIHSSPLPLGHGMVKTQHGTLPVPAPAVLEILEDAPVYGSGIPTEIVTPTGAAILKTLARSFGEIPPIKVERTGYGAGTKDIGRPNVLRVILGEGVASGGFSVEAACLISSNIDDMNPELYDYVVQRLFKAGASDVWLTPIQMKKTRPGTTINVLCSPEHSEQIREILVSETSTFGVRTAQVLKHAIERETISVRTRWGEVRVKIGRFSGEVTSVSPEFSDCARVAEETGVPIKKVYNAAQTLAMKKLRKG